MCDKWTEQAIECYKRHCHCAGCLIYDVLGNNCHMKKSVLKLFAEFGEPKEKVLPDINEVFEYIDKGMDLKDIAPIFNMSKNQFYEYTKAHGINGRLIKGGEMGKRYMKRKRQND